MPNGLMQDDNKNFKRLRGNFMANPEENEDELTKLRNVLKEIFAELQDEEEE